MPGYRLLARHLPGQRGQCRALVLRDPTDGARADPTPIAPATTLPGPFKPSGGFEVTSVAQSRWLYGWSGGAPMEMSLHGVRLSRPRRIRLLADPEVGVDGRRALTFEAEDLTFDAQGGRVQLFGSLTTLRDGVDLALGTAEQAELRAEVQALADAFCCSQDIVYGKRTPAAAEVTGPDSRPDDRTEAVGPSALIQTWLDDRPLHQIAEEAISDKGEPGPLALAALSGYVFDLDKPPDPTSVGGGTVGKIAFHDGEGQTLESADLELVPDKSVQIIELALAAEQEAEGVYLKLDWRLTSVTAGSPLETWKAWAGSRFPDPGSIDSATRKKLNDISDHTLVVRRSIGGVPVFSDAPIARMPLAVVVAQQSSRIEPTAGKEVDQPGHPSRYLYIDRLESRQFVGQLLHYQIEIRNVVDKPVARGLVSVRRQQLDPPSMPLKADAYLSLESDGEPSLRVEVEWPAGDDDLVPMIWYQTRPLDACGFFGTDDDLALEEGLRLADLNFEDGADQAEPRDWEGHPVARYLRGAYDRYGLQRLDGVRFDRITDEDSGGTDGSDKKRNRARATLDKATFDKLCRLHRSGARLLIALRRPPTPDRFADPKGGIESVLRPCDHWLVVNGDSPKRIFQLENIPAAATTSPNRLNADQVQIQGLINGKVVDALQAGHVWVASQSAAASDAGMSGPPYRLRIQFSVRSRSDPRRAGGYRIWMRDVVGSAQTPFVRVSEFEAVPSMVYRYRPYRIDSLRRLAAWSRPSAELSAPEPIGFSAQEAQTCFHKLDADLRTGRSGARLVRSDVGPTKDPDQGDILPPLNPGERFLAQLRRQLLQTVSIIAPDQPPANPAAPEARSDNDRLSDLLAAVARHPADPAGAQRDLLNDLLCDWSLLAPFVDWAYANGLARDLILPPGMQTVESLEPLLGWIQSATGKEKSFLLLAVVPSALSPLEAPTDNRLLATVRLCLLPAGEAIKSDPFYLKLLLPALRLAAARRVNVFREIDESPSLRAFDEAGVCTVDCPGATDGWRHQIECVVERLDRYARVRPSPSRPDGDRADPTPGALPFADSDLLRFVIPRRLPAPHPPAARAVAGAKRVAFVISETAERLAATRNLLMRVRSGRITRIAQFKYHLPWLGRFTSVLTWTAAPDDGPAVSAEVVGIADPDGKAEPVGDAVATSEVAWSGADEDQVEVVDPLFFARYQLFVRHHADQVEGAWPKAEQCPWTQCQPTLDNEAFQVRYPADRKMQLVMAEVATGAAGKSLNLPLIRLCDLLSAAQQQQARMRYRLPAGMLDLPDLEAVYTVLVRTGGRPWLPLAVLRMPGYGTGDPPEPRLEHHASPAGAAGPDQSKATPLAGPAIELPGATLALPLDSLFGGPVPTPADLRVLCARGPLWAHQEIRL